ncbi:DUF2059 domain-containing protein [Duganella sp. BJB480]|uniref:DUF2059 domain-containing protein n=1 Tax=unclassified Duganella TaxID=2636909 RepID=UPI000E34CF60|nr:MULTISPECIES: DUF2059 domain-containing protein [unclassified Duganella]RFP26263.1 DUF2059 domain-containing protein [Duganella sp. BJB489]RFP37195.1 DUF2059 domain-containing protein [Duganella sp. BJB480]
MNSARAVILCALLSLAVPGHAAAPARPAAAAKGLPDEATRKATEDLLEALQLPVLVRHEMRQLAGVTAEQQDLLRHMSNHVADASIIGTLAPVYAAYLTRADARRLAVHYRTETGRKRVAAMLVQAGASAGEAHPAYSDAERLEIKRIESLPGARALQANGDALKDRRRYAILNWSTVYKTVLLRQANYDMRNQVQTLLDARREDPLPNPALTPTGLTSLDNMTALVIDNNHRTALMDAAFKADMAAYDIEHVLENERMVSKEGIARSKNSLALAEARIERHLRDQQENLRSYWEQLRAVIADPAADEYTEPLIAKVLTLLVRSAETERATLDTLNRILNFYESRLGSVTLQDGQLVFKNESDRQLLLALDKQLDQSAAEGKDLANDARTMIEDALELKPRGR